MRPGPDFSSERPDAIRRVSRLEPATEHGAASWMDIMKALTALSIARYEEMAAALLEAYRTGSSAAMERHWTVTWHRRRWEVMRTYVQLDLGRQVGGPDWMTDITLEDAHYLIAREHGFESWQALRDFAAGQTAETEVADKPVTVYSSQPDGSATRIADLREWDAVVEVMTDQRMSVLRAAGQMTDRALARLAELDHITDLDLAGSKALTDEGASQLARLGRLRKLDLSGTSLSDQALAAIGQLHELTDLRLSCTNVTDQGLSHLAACRHLQRIDLTGSRTGDGAIRTLAGLPGLRDFRSGLMVTDAGIPLLQGFPVFRAWQGGPARIGLLDYDAEPNYLLLRGALTAKGVANLAPLEGLFALNLDDDSLADTASGLPRLTGMPHLSWLAFPATDESMPAIAALPHLRFLMCQDTPAGDDGFHALSQSKSLEAIWGRRCYNLQERGFKALSRIPSLRSLSVSCKNVNEAGISALPGFPALRELMPMDVPDEGYRYVGRCERLQTLILMYCRETTDRATEQIIGLPELNSYFASYTGITDRTPELLSSMLSLSAVEFSGCAGLTDTGIRALSRLPRLLKLTVGGSPGVTENVSTAFPTGVSVQIGP